MKDLLIMRHAKSSWDPQYSTDFERPLNKRGMKAAPRMGRFLLDQNLAPSLIVSSPAVRARQTAEAVAESLSYQGDMVLDQSIYHASVPVLLEVVHGIPEETKLALVVGHNPGIEELVEELCGGYVRMPTAAIAFLSANVDTWRDVGSTVAKLHWLVNARLFED